MRRQQEGHGKD